MTKRHNCNVDMTFVQPLNILLTLGHVATMHVRKTNLPLKFLSHRILFYHDTFYIGF